MDLSTGHITGLEALARWQHPDLGLVPPTQFIPVAEDSGLIVPIGEWTLRTACTHTKAWHDAGYHGLIVSLNLSARQLTAQYDLVPVVARVLRETGLAALFLVVELRECMVVNSSETTLTTVHAYSRHSDRLIEL